MDFKVMKKIVLVLLAVLLIPTDAFAYSFSVQVFNKTGGTLWISNKVGIYAKGTSLPGLCTSSGGGGGDTPEIENNENIQYLSCNARAQKWQRAITVSFSCDYPDVDLRTVRFPKSKKWYDRGYPAKNGDRYTILVKKKDC